MIWLAVLLLIGPAGTGVHVDARDHPTPGAGVEAFSGMERALVRGFDNVCGDTFCEGDYSNLRALQLRCAVRRDSGAVSECLWSFAGSHAAVRAETPVPEVDARVWACRLPTAPATPLSALLALLSGPDAIDTPLPGTGISVYGSLVGCL